MQYSRRAGEANVQGEARDFGSRQAAGEKEAAIALWLGITVRPVARVWKLYKTKGAVSPLEPKGRPPKLGKADFAKVAGEAGKGPRTQH